MTEKSQTLTRALRHSIKSEFSDFLKCLGFNRYELDDSSGLGYFFRRRVGHHWNLIDIQFDQYHRAKFVLEFGKFPVGGIVDNYGRHVADDEVRCYMLSEGGRLHKSKVLFVWIWFGVSKLKETVFGRENAIAREIHHLKSNFTQVERWFGDGTVGPCLNTKLR